MHSSLHIPSTLNCHNINITMRLFVLLQLFFNWEIYFIFETERFCTKGLLDGLCETTGTVVVCMWQLAADI